jgi:hypothetical protein
MEEVLAVGVGAQEPAAVEPARLTREATLRG